MNILFSLLGFAYGSGRIYLSEYPGWPLADKILTEN